MDVAELIGTTNYIDYKALGYPGDPIAHSGRFDKLMLTVGRPEVKGHSKVDSKPFKIDTHAELVKSPTPRHSGERRSP